MGGHDRIAACRVIPAAVIGMTTLDLLTELSELHIRRGPCERFFVVGQPRESVLDLLAERYRFHRLDKLTIAGRVLTDRTQMDRRRQPRDDYVREVRRPALTVLLPGLSGRLRVPDASTLPNTGRQNRHRHRQGGTAITESVSGHIPRIRTTS